VVNLDLETPLQRQKRTTITMTKTALWERVC
jgi:hypothetical protein